MLGVRSIAAKITEKAAAFHVDLGGRLDKLVNPVPAKRADILQKTSRLVLTLSKMRCIRTRLLQMHIRVVIVESNSMWQL
jgi:hypothetical protein